MLKSALIVGIGSFAGGMLRFIISYLMKNACSSAFPWGTFIVNLLGCLLIGVFYAIFAKYSSCSHTLCLLLTTGFCGGFTTFSTFSNESLSMLHAGNWVGFISYVSLSVVIGILMTFLGYSIFK